METDKGLQCQWPERVRTYLGLTTTPVPRVLEVVGKLFAYPSVLWGGLALVRLSDYIILLRVRSISADLATVRVDVDYIPVIQVTV